MEVIYHQNKFQGINPILQTILQTSGSPLQYQGFHGSEITHMADLLNGEFFNLPYYAVSEQNLTIGSSFYRPDVSVLDKPFDSFKDMPNIRHQAKDLQAHEPSLITTVPLPTAMRSLVIYGINPDTPIPVTVIEILSPANLEGTGVETYIAKRTHLLRAGINLVELHYLSAFSTILEYIPAYPDDTDSQPFHIAVTRPENQDDEGKYLTEVYLFGVDMTIPTVKIPLLGETNITFDFDLAYQRTYESGFWGRFIDYAELPSNLEKMFSPTDYQKILNKVQQILDADSSSE